MHGLGWWWWMNRVVATSVLNDDQPTDGTYRKDAPFPFRYIVRSHLLVLLFEPPPTIICGWSSMVWNGVVPSVFLKMTWLLPNSECCVSRLHHLSGVNFGSRIVTVSSNDRSNDSGRPNLRMRRIGIRCSFSLDELAITVLSFLHDDEPLRKLSAAPPVC